MKKSFILTICVCIFTCNVNSQNNKSKNNSKNSVTIALPEKLSKVGANTFEKGQVDLNLGIGIFRNGYYYGRGYYRISPPLSASLDYGITKNISIGAYFAYTRSVYRYDGQWNNGNGWYDYRDTYTWSYYIVGARAAFHLAEYLEVDNLDVYGGIMVGNNFAKYKYSTNDPNNSHTVVYDSRYGGFVWGLYAGGRYMFTEKVGMFGEFGFGLSYGTIGLNIKL